MPVIIYPRQGRTDSGKTVALSRKRRRRNAQRKVWRWLDVFQTTTTEYNLWNGGPLYRQRPGRDLTVLPAGERARLAGWSVNRETEGGRIPSSRSDGRPIWRCPWRTALDDRFEWAEPALCVSLGRDREARGLARIIVRNW